MYTPVLRNYNDLKMALNQLILQDHLLRYVQLWWDFTILTIIEKYGHILIKMYSWHFFLYLGSSSSNDADIPVVTPFIASCENCEIGFFCEDCFHRFVQKR